MTPRTIRNWEAGRTFAPTMARKLLRALRGGRIADPAWADWRIHHGSLYPPTGLRGYAPWELEQLAAVLRQAALFRSLYNQLNPRRQLTPPTVLRAVRPTDDLRVSSEPFTLRPTDNTPADIDEAAQPCPTQKVSK